MRRVRKPICSASDSPLVWPSTQTALRVAQQRMRAQLLVRCIPALSHAFRLEAQFAAVAWRGLGCERVIAEKPVERRARTGSTVTKRRPHAPFRECRVRGRVRQTRVLARTQLADGPAIDRKQQSEVHPRSLPVRTSTSSSGRRSAGSWIPMAKQQCNPSVLLVGKRSSAAAPNRDTLPLPTKR